MKSCGLVEAPEAHEVPRLIDAMQLGVRLFVDPGQRDELEAALRQLAGRRAPTSTTERIPVKDEDDLLRARAIARQLAREMGARSLIVQKVSSAVSELGQNALLHAGGGVVEVSTRLEPPRSIVIVVSDEGPGIPNIERALGVRPKATTGLGLAGIRRGVDRFEIKSGVRGTRVEVEIVL